MDQLSSQLSCYFWFIIKRIQEFCHLYIEPLYARVFVAIHFLVRHVGIYLRNTSLQVVNFQPNSLSPSL